MDSVTQIALGAAVGEAVAGKKAGGRAAAWGAVGGTIPDLDILLNPFLGPVQQLAMHRGISHSFLFAIIAAPILGWLVHRFFHRRGDATFRDWWLVFFAAIVTHPILDYFTIYGTQLFMPFSDYPAALGSIFIIDPLYTLPLAGALIVALRYDRASSKRRFWNYAGLTFSTLYLAFSVGAKFTAQQQFAHSLEQRGIEYERIFVAPGPLTTLLWMGMAEDRNADRIWVGLYSFFDDLDGGAIEFQSVEKNSVLIAGTETQRAVSRLLWFSRGWFQARRNAEDAVVFQDLRFGRSDGWLDDEGDYIFVFELIPGKNGEFVSFRRRTPRFDVAGERFSRLFRRIQGIRAQSGSGPAHGQP